MIALQDNFRGANEPLANHTPQVGGPWTQVAGNIAIFGNKAVCIDNAAAENQGCIASPDLGNIGIARVSGVVQLEGSQAGRGIRVGLNNGSGSIDLTLTQGNSVQMDYQEGSGPAIYAEADGNFPAGNYPFAIQLSGNRVRVALGDITLQGQAALPVPSMTAFNLMGKATGGNIVSFRNVVVQGQSK